MKPHFRPLFLLAFFFVSLSGISQNSSLIGLEPLTGDFVKIDPFTATTNVLATGNPVSFSIMTKPAYDAENEIYYFLAKTSSTAPIALFSYDAVTGTARTPVPLNFVNPGDNPGPLFWDPASGDLYCLYHYGRYVTTLDPATGNFTFISTQPVAKLKSMALGSVTFDPNLGIFHIFGYDSLNRESLFQIDQSTGTLLTHRLTPTSTWEIPRGTMFNCADGHIYCMRGNPLRLAKINPTTHNITDVSGVQISDFMNFTYFGLDPLHNTYTYMGRNNGSTSDFFHTVNLANGALVNSTFIPPTSSAARYNFLLPGNSGYPKADFTHSFGCTNAAIPFEFNGSGIFVNWDFGDPSSSQNTAQGGNPTHTFSAPGIYTVTAIATGCSGADTIAYPVTVTAAPVPNLGDDVLICPGDSVTLNAGLAGVPVLWSTGETTLSIDVSGPGFYTVIANPGTPCAAIDTVVISIDPLCGTTNLYGQIIVFPNPAVASVMVRSPWKDELQQIEVYTIHGDLIYSRSFQHGNSPQMIPIQTVNWRKGIYFLRMQNGKDVRTQNIWIK